MRLKPQRVPPGRGPHSRRWSPLAITWIRSFRADKPGANDPDAKAEAGRILLMGAKNGTIPDGEKAYLGQLVAARTGMPQEAAVKRVNDVIGQVEAAETKVREVADQTRKATAQGSFFLFFSMLIGAFIASVAGAVGGRQRDEL